MYIDLAETFFKSLVLLNIVPFYSIYIVPF